MPDQPIPEKFRRYYKENTVGELWSNYLTEGNVRLRRNRPFFSRLPSNPRCVNCHRPFAGIGGALMRLIYRDLVQKSDKNPRYCFGCHSFMYEIPGGAEVELTMLFVDVRGSTTIAENMDTLEFSRLMNRFYEAAIKVLVRADAFIDKLVGDEVTALFIPGYAGKDYAHKAVEAGKALLQVTGHGSARGPWVPVGVGIHTGTAWVGSIVGASGAAADFTALGDNVNIAARLASNAGPGEVLISESTYKNAQVNNDSLEKRTLELKGKSEKFVVHVMNAT
jgi:adenylate cyclase